MLKRIALLTTVVCSLAFTSMLAFADMPLDTDCVPQFEQTDVWANDFSPSSELIDTNKVDKSVSCAEPRRNLNFGNSLRKNRNAAPAFEVGWQYSF